MIQAMFELCRGLRFDSNSKYMRAEYAYWFHYSIYNHRTTKTNQKYPSVNL